MMTCDLTTCPCCGEVEQIEKMIAVDETCLCVQDGDFATGTLLCAECYAEVA